jgi:hypothetical protein
MFCPNCKAEYRPGFTKCSDCDVDLVEHLSSDNLVADGKVTTDSDGRELLWSGLSARLQATICSALDSARIAHKESVREFGLLPTTVQSASFIWIEPRDRAAARSVLDKVLAGPEFSEQLSEEVFAETGRVNPLSVDRRVFIRAETEESVNSEDEPDESGETNELTPNDFVEDPDPDDATRQVWAGEDGEMALYLADCLRGVGVGCVLSTDGDKSRVLVLPEAETRAREIVREVLDAAPPQ